MSLSSRCIYYQTSVKIDLRVLTSLFYWHVCDCVMLFLSPRSLTLFFVPKLCEGFTKATFLPENGRISKKSDKLENCVTSTRISNSRLFCWSRICACACVCVCTLIEQWLLKKRKRRIACKSKNLFRYLNSFPYYFFFFRLFCNEIQVDSMYCVEERARLVFSMLNIMWFPRTSNHVDEFLSLHSELT